VTQDDQRSTDLDAALDAVIPSLTAVDDDAAAQSLRQTRIALAEGRRAADGPGAWRWGLTAAAAAIVLAAAAMVWQGRTPDTPRTATAPRTPAPAVAPVTPIAQAPPERVVTAAPTPRAAARRPNPVRATSVESDTPGPKPDPLIALVRAVQQIPEDAWSRSVARANSPVIVQDVTVTSIDVTPLASPADVAIEPFAPGEP
jgi:hypothetical protein